MNQFPCKSCIIALVTLNSQLIKQVIHQFDLPCSSNKQFDLCSSCHLGKLARISLASIKHVSTAPLGIVQMDIWGPSPVLSNLDYRKFCLIQPSIDLVVNLPTFQTPKSSTNSSQRTHPIILCSSTLKLHEANTALKYPLPTCSLNDIETKPTIYEQACPHEEWQQATREIHALHINQTWSLVPQPAKCNLVGNK